MNLLKAVYLIREAEMDLHGSYRSEEEGVFVVGCGRSGTTLLRRILGAHPNLSSGPETHFFSKLNRWYTRWTGKAVHCYDWDWIEKLANRFQLPPGEVTGLRADSACLPEYADRFFDRHLRDDGAKRWVEKTPGHVREVDYVHTYFPGAKIVHVLRNPRDVVASLRTHPRWNLVHGERVRNRGEKPLEECIDRWLTDVSAGLTGRELPSSSYYELKYEELVSSFEESLRGLLEFLGEPWSDELFTFYEDKDREEALTNNVRANQPLDPSRVGRWKEELEPGQIDRVDRRTADLAGRLDYGYGG